MDNKNTPSVPIFLKKIIKKKYRYSDEAIPYSLFVMIALDQADNFVADLLCLLYGLLVGEHVAFLVPVPQDRSQR